jgi:hypothetical protein
MEKIIAALFIVTDSIERNDLVKLRVREVCLDILSFMNSMDLDGELSPLVARQMAPVKCFIDEILSVLNVSKMSGLISEMNYQILNKELELFCVNLDGDQALPDLFAGSLTSTEKKSDFDQTGRGTDQPGSKLLINTDLRTDQPGSNPRSTSNGHIKDTPKISNSQLPISNKFRANPRLSASSFVDSRPIRVDPRLDQRPSASSLGSGWLSKTKRKDIILNFIKDKGVVTIKDICKIKDKSIVSCSEKTIQRELMSLIKEGVIKREGDKRWTKYSLQ